MRGILAALAFSALLVGGASACSSYNNDRGIGDAPIDRSQIHDDKWQIINGPDGFGNLATQCNPVQPGTRIYVVTHSKTDTQPLVQPDAACGKAQ